MGDSTSDDISTPTDKPDESSMGKFDSKSPVKSVMGKPSETSPHKAYPTIKAHMPKHLGAPGASTPTEFSTRKLKPQIYGKSRLERRLHGKPPPSELCSH